MFLVQNIACGFNQEAGEPAAGCSSAQLSFRGARWHAGGALFRVSLVFLLGWTSWFQRKVLEPGSWKTETAGLADLPGPNLLRRHFCFKVSSPAGSLTTASG